MINEENQPSHIGQVKFPLRMKLMQITSGTKVKSKTTKTEPISNYWLTRFVPSVLFTFSANHQTGEGIMQHILLFSSTSKSLIINAASQAQRMQIFSECKFSSHCVKHTHTGKTHVHTLTVMQTTKVLLTFTSCYGKDVVIF